MKICIYGAGAIGGLLGARLARAGEDVTLIARGPHLAAMRANGLSLTDSKETFTVRPRALEDPEEAGEQDVVIVTLKAHAVPAVTARMPLLLGPKTAVVMAVNGVPWWYFHGLSGDLAGRRLQIVDPDGQQWMNIGPERVIGCVAYPAAEIREPGHVLHVEGDRFSLGEPDGAKSERVRVLSAALAAAGFKAPVKPDIRSEIWVKLWGNAVFNPISALTGATLQAICSDLETARFARSAMAEVERVANALGVTMPVSIDKRFAGAKAVGEHKTSMLQDLENGRPLELDALVGAVIELANLSGQAVPLLEGLYALTKLRAERLHKSTEHGSTTALPASRTLSAENRNG
ncbi:MAG: 2-dehydropantoate 2-reductase [Rhodospirillales bacterium]|nr:2-dehydropantoate 2-reductase [Rhodospirillales bacterium]